MKRLSTVRAVRRRSTAPLCLLVLVSSISSFGCEDRFETRSGRAGGFWGDGRRGDGWGDDGWRGRWPRRHHGRGDGQGPDAGASDAGVDGGLDGGPPNDAGNSGASSGSDGAGGLVDAGAAPDAGGPLDPEVAASSDGQIVLLVDTLLSGSVEQAGAALSGLADPGVVGYAERVLDEDAAAQSTLASLASAIGATPEDSALADTARAANEATLAQLVEPDAGAIDGIYINAQVDAHTRSIPLLQQLAAAADAPALRAQLTVLLAIEQAQLERAQEVAADL